MTDSSLGVVIPAYEPSVDRLASYVDRINQQLTPETILIELDAPSAQTVTALRELPVQVNAVPYRRGKGAAITAGFERLNADIYLFADADGATPVDSLESIYDPVRTERAALAVGSRRHPDASVDQNQTAVREFLGDCFSGLASSLLPVRLHDYQCGAKAIDAAAWNCIKDDLYEPGFAWDVELIAMAGAHDLTVTEVPVEWEDRPGSTVDPVEDSLRMFRALLTSRHRAKQLDNDRLHAAVAARRPQPTPLVDRGQEL